MNWFEEAFGDFQEMQWYTLITVIAVIAAGIAGFIWYRRKHPDGGSPSRSAWTTKELSTAALCIGLSFLLSFIQLFRMPQGGSITPASMLPLLGFAYIYGVRKGILAGLVYGLLQLMQDPVILAPMQVILDYFLAFASLGLAGLTRHLTLGIIYGCAARFICQFLSGWIFFGMYAPEGTPAWIYSLGYSGSVCGVECAICIAVALIPQLHRMFTRLRSQGRGIKTAFPESPTHAS